MKENSNLNNSERFSLYQLRNSKDLVFKTVDKGSIFVIMDKVNYLMEGYKQLNNVKHYLKPRLLIIINGLTVAPIENPTSSVNSKV